jgi:prepilin-type N-terminal cleavage/methylation domain-containing protein
MRIPNRRSAQAAFSLVEILVVILILAIAAAIVVPNIGSAGDSEAISAARVMKSDLEVARSMALTTQHPHAVVFSADRQSYKIVANYAGEDYASAVAVAHPVLGNKSFVVHLASQNGMSNVAVVSVSFDGATYVTFNSQGDPSSGGTVTLRSGSTQMQIAVAGLTGAITATRIAG